MPQPKTSHFDFIIAGAGAAGLSLLYEIMNSPELADKRILLVDRQLDPDDSKTWCFWDDSNLSLRKAIHRSWQKLEVRLDGISHAETLQNFSYHCVQSRDYSRMILEDARASSMVTLLEADIRDFSSSGQIAELHSSLGNYTADLIFQSALVPPGSRKSPMGVSLKQQFAGWEIRMDKPVFDPGKATLMDFDTPQQGGVTFFYVLPFSNREALVEYTIFTEILLSENSCQDALQQYIDNRLRGTGSNKTDYTILRREQGVIPMEDRRYPAWYCDRVLNLGTVGGLTKASTGYTFSRIQKHSKLIVQALANGKDVPVRPPSSYRFRVYDVMILYLLKTDPELAKNILCNMFRINGFDRIFSFLEERTRPAEEIKIFSSLPYRPFFIAIWKMKHRIFRGM